ncbi:MAG: hypothetical protein QME45_00340 [Clostridiales bacterium]|nr:hypothetical protein [Clostridiales bacterium]
MSKINAVRIVNLNYNKNTMRINDETFEFGGESTLVSLRNGGGKTVLVQMMMAPFVNARYRDLKDRKFENYFISPIPTYILVEWLLDNNSSYVLIGMGIKRRSASPDDESRGALDIFTFIHEYKEGNEYDIHNFPVTEKTERGFKVKTFSYIKKVMDGIKADRQYIFDYFDLDIDSQRRKYFDILKQYNINHREWESIIKRINLKESGLSDLFQDSKTIPGLVEKWFLPTVEDKLNDKDDKIKNFQEIMKKFIYQYKENENKILRKNGINEFKTFSSNIMKSSQEFRSAKMNTQRIKNDIANLYAYIVSRIKSISDEKVSLEEKLAGLREEIDEIEYERLSFEYYGLIGEIDKLVADERELKVYMEGCETRIKQSEDKIALQECAKLYKQYKEASRNVQQYENMLDTAKSEDQVKQKERNNLGFTLRKLYDGIVENRKKKLSSKTDEKLNTEKLIGDLRLNEEKQNGRIAELTGEKASLKSNIMSYNKEEDNFIKKYNQVLRRNIIGEYDSIVLDSYKKGFKDRIDKTDIEYGEMLREQEKVTQELPQKRKQLEDEKLKKIQLNANFKDAKKDAEAMEKSVDEIRKILLYSSMEENRVFDREYILKQLARKIESLKADRDVLSKQRDGLEKERGMYETGRNVRLSDEIEERLRILDIHIVFGLEWLKKQYLAREKKEELIKKNPFLPYSLIMTRDNLDRLKNEEAEVFTSFPVPIIEQERLEDSLDVKVANNVYTLGNINFFIAFNSRILNEEELKKLIDVLSSKIEEVKGFISIKDEEIGKYTGDYKKVEDFNIGKADIINMQKMIDEIRNDIDDNSTEISLLIDKVHFLEENQKKLDKAVRNIEDRKRDLEDERKDFSALMDEYGRYLKDNEQFKEKEIELQKARDAREKINSDLKKQEALLNTINEQLTNLKIKFNDDNNKAGQYLNFKEGEIVDRDIEDIEARYISLTQKIGLKVKQLEDVLSEFRRNFKDYEDELIKKSDEYGFQESQYSIISYDQIALKTLKAENIQYESDLKKATAKLHDIEIIKIQKKDKQRYKLDEIHSMGRETPKDRMYISNLDFKGRKEIKSREINECNRDIKEKEDLYINLNDTKNRMNEYADFVVSEPKTPDYPLGQVDGIREELRKAYMESIGEERGKENMLSDCCQELSMEGRFSRDEFFKNTVDTLLEIKHNPEDVIKTLKTIDEVHVKMLKQLETDLSKVEEEKRNIIDMFYEYVEQVYEHIGRIDDNSSININGKYIKMLNIIQPDWDKREEQYRMLSRDFVENTTKSCLDELSKGENIEEILSTEITTKKLYDYIVGISEIDIRLYKIEASRQVQISWNQVSENSGGEGFLSAFVILSSLLSYMRKEESDIFKTSEEGKVIIMDNPFAQTNAEHLLKPLMEIARKNNTQLICFTGLGGDSIYNRFDNIYVLNLVDSKFKPGMRFIEGEHKKGEEMTNMTSSRFKIQMEKTEQLRLF